MKELSIEEKAKHYDEALEKAKNYHSPKTECNVRIAMENLFPELKKCEDAKIIKNIINWLKNIEGQTIPINDYNSAIAWLEKKGGNENNEKINFSEQNSTEKTDVLMSIDEAIEHCKEKSCGNNACALEHKQLEKWLTELKELKEQKSTENIDPKFEIGDWCIDNEDGTIFQITKVLDNTYTYKTNEGKEYSCPIHPLENDTRLWTIKDAKDGDVLCCKSGWTCIFKALDNNTNTFSSYCFMDNTKWFCETGSECHTLEKSYVNTYNRELYPATKEQHDTLIKVMTDAGYTFDFEKKELKKIEDEPTLSEEDEGWFKEIELMCLKFSNDTNYREKFYTWVKALKEKVLSPQKQEWSEEDEINRDLLYNALNQVYDMEHNKDLSNWINKRILLCSKQHVWSEEDEEMYKKIETAINSYYAPFSRDAEEMSEWFKNIKNIVQHRSQWKPSDIQMHYLYWIANIRLGDSVVEQDVSKHLNELFEDLKKLRGE